MPDCRQHPPPDRRPEGTRPAVGRRATGGPWVRAAVSRRTAGAAPPPVRAATSAAARPARDPQPTVGHHLEAGRLHGRQRIAAGVAATEQARPHRGVQYPLSRRASRAPGPCRARRTAVPRPGAAPAAPRRGTAARPARCTAPATRRPRQNASLFTGSASATPGTTSTGTSARSPASTAIRRSTTLRFDGDDLGDGRGVVGEVQARCPRPPRRRGPTARPATPCGARRSRPSFRRARSRVL